MLIWGEGVNRSLEVDCFVVGFGRNCYEEECWLCVCGALSGEDGNKG